MKYFQLHQLATKLRLPFRCLLSIFLHKIFISTRLRLFVIYRAVTKTGVLLIHVRSNTYATGIFFI